MDELEAELCDARELIISLIDERNDVDYELTEVRKQRQDYKTQLQNTEIELSKKILEKDEINHNYELANKQIHRYSQQLEEEQQKIELLNIQTGTLQDSLQKEKQTNAELLKKISDMTAELKSLNKTMEEVQTELIKLRKEQELAENLTDSSTKDAIMKLSMIILSKDKSYSLTPEQRYLIKQVFGENCTKLIDSAEKRIEELNQKNRKLRENCLNLSNLVEYWISEALSLCDWIEVQNELLEQGEYDQITENFNAKIADLSKTRKDAVEANNKSKSTLSLTTRLSIKEREDSLNSVRPLYGTSASKDEVEKLHKRNMDQKKELEELRNKLHDAYLLESQMRDQITELISHNSSLKKNSPKVELMRFLQCQASIVEDLINEQVAED